MNATFQIIAAFKITSLTHHLQVPNLFFPPLANVIPPPLHPGTGVIERIDNNMFPLGARLYLIQFWGKIIKGQMTEQGSASICAVAPSDKTPCHPII